MTFEMKFYVVLYSLNGEMRKKSIYTVLFDLVWRYIVYDFLFSWLNFVFALMCVILPIDEVNRSPAIK